MDGTIIREWHPQGRVPSRLGRRKTLTPFLLWRGPLVPTAPLNSSIGVGWITPAYPRKKHRIGAGLRRFTQKTPASYTTRVSGLSGLSGSCRCDQPWLGYNLYLNVFRIYFAYESLLYLTHENHAATLLDNVIRQVEHSTAFLT